MTTHQVEQEFGSAVVAFVEGLRGRFDDHARETALDFAGHGEWELAIAVLRQAVKKRRLRLTDEETLVSTSWRGIRRSTRPTSIPFATAGSSRDPAWGEGGRTCESAADL